MVVLFSYKMKLKNTSTQVIYITRIYLFTTNGRKIIIQCSFNLVTISAAEGRRVGSSVIHM